MWLLCMAPKKCCGWCRCTSLCQGQTLHHMTWPPPGLRGSVVICKYRLWPLSYWTTYAYLFHFVIFPCLLCATIHAWTTYLLTFPFMATQQMLTCETFSLSLKTYKIHLYVSPTLLLYSFQATGLYLLLYDMFLFFPQSLCPHSRLRWDIYNTSTIPALLTCHSYCLLCARCMKAILFFLSLFQKAVLHSIVTQSATIAWEIL